MGNQRIDEQKDGKDEKKKACMKKQGSFGIVYKQMEEIRKVHSPSVLEKE
jgi:hypothetical protein